MRWYRVRSSGPAGASPWVTSSHAYGTPAAAVIDSASAETNGSVTRVTASWRAAYDDLSPIDTITLQYVVAVPTDTALTAPASGWSDAIEVTPNGGEDKVVVNVQAAIAVDECMWVRVKTDHDTNLNYSGELVAQAGKLGAPTIAADPDTSTGSVNITITETTTCDVACTAIFCRLEDDPSNDRIIGVLAHGVTSGTYSVPDIIGDTTTCFGAFALSVLTPERSFRRFSCGRIRRLIRISTLRRRHPSRSKKGRVMRPSASGGHGHGTAQHRLSSHGLTTLRHGRARTSLTPTP